jgi:pyruvate dehydrogenase E2 component (dihydrolipoamide acetyltransferase)
MPVDVQVPKLGLTMREGTISQWVAPNGTVIAKGDVLMLLATDKVEVEIEAEAGGILHHAVPEGTTLSPGALAGWLLAEGEAPPVAGGAGPEPTDDATPVTAGAPTGADPVDGAAGAGPPGASVDGASRRLLASPSARRVARELGVDLSGIAGTGPNGRIVSSDVTAAEAGRPVAVPAASPQPAPVEAPRTLLISPVAERLAVRTGVDPASVRGTGPGGRITLDDVVAAVGPRPAGTEPPTAPTTAAPRPGPQAGDVIAFSGMRGVIAQRMRESLQQAAQLTLGFEARVDRLLALRAELKRDLAATDQPVPGITDLLVKAVAVALTEHPLLNAVVDEHEVRLVREVNIGLAVALDDGLIVPVIKHADLLPVADLAAEATRLAAAARANKLGLDELQGSTFSVTGLGSRGVDVFTPIINPPNAAILGVGRIRDTTLWEGEHPVRASAMTLSLTIDHRAVDGAPAADFLGTLRDLIEAPTRLLVS